MSYVSRLRAEVGTDIGAARAKAEYRHAGRLYALLDTERPSSTSNAFPRVRKGAGELHADLWARIGTEVKVAGHVLADARGGGEGRGMPQRRGVYANLDHASHFALPA